MKKLLRVLFTTALMIMVFSVKAFGADLDVTEIIGSGVTEIISQLMAILGLVVAGIIGFVGARLAITKGIQLFRALVNRA